MGCFFCVLSECLVWKECEFRDQLEVVDVNEWIGLGMMQRRRSVPASIYRG